MVTYLEEREARLAGLQHAKEVKRKLLAMPNATIWADILPPSVMIHQLAWERRQIIFRMRTLGFTIADIINRLGISRHTCSVTISKRHESSSLSPAERWMRGLDHVHIMVAKLRTREKI